MLKFDCRKSVVAAACLVALTGCGAKPSALDAAKVIAKDINAQNCSDLKHHLYGSDSKHLLARCNGGDFSSKRTVSFKCTKEVRSTLGRDRPKKATATRDVLCPYSLKGGDKGDERLQMLRIDGEWKYYFFGP